ncbi:hypothetical protein GEV33_008863 [Tenebrio molitor]|uniref:G-protein coupled receptors family 2 profile 2 domain-containing protein n=1 Tax=Tenebrio molitor TaxID=7067 RepID=A0A8J6HGD9_TENMO|nr:hypothetical protein GEV33_008863 [Tenebrio molitor]
MNVSHFCVLLINNTTFERACLANGTWTKADYSNCKEIILIPDVETQATIYFVGYVLSLITLSIALGIFTYFKELRCLRNRIHMNLMWSYMLMYCMWIVTLTALGSKGGGGGSSIACVFIVTLLHYFHISTFFWMFVEGLYLYILVVETLTRENFKLRVYVCIGWGLPMVFILIWVVVKSFIPSAGDPSTAHHTGSELHSFMRFAKIVPRHANIVTRHAKIVTLKSSSDSDLEVKTSLDDHTGKFACAIVFSSDEAVLSKCHRNKYGKAKYYRRNSSLKCFIQRIASLLLRNFGGSYGDVFDYKDEIHFDEDSKNFAVTHISRKVCQIPDEN